MVQGGSSSQGGGVTPQGGLPHNAHLHITYNAGLQALQLGKYSTALRCFQVSVPTPLSFLDGSVYCIPGWLLCVLSAALQAGIVQHGRCKLMCCAA